MIGAFLLTGIYFSIGTKFFQFRGFFTWMKYTFGTMKGEVVEEKDGKSITQFQSLCTALAGTLGTGNIAGVATAITAGGAGAIFWMWISSIFGMMTNFAEKTLGILYRYKGEDGEWVGGPMVYMERGLHAKGLAISFAFLCILASFGMGNMTQAHSVSEAIQVSFGGNELVIGIILSVLLALVILGGIGRIASVTEKLIPIVAIGYTVGSVCVLIRCHENILPAFFSIIEGAFSVKAVGGGVLGYGMKKAIMVGISRGIFSNEAGLGSSVIVHSASNVKSPVIQGFWGIQEVFLDTIVMCTLTALVILTSGVYDGTKEIDGMMLTTKAFAVVFGSRGGRFISVAVVIFGFATLIGWSYYGVKCVEYLFGKKWTVLYQGIYCGVTVIGCTMELTTVWNFADNMNGLLAIPNLIAILLLSKYVFAEIRNFEQREKEMDKKKMHKE
ncbi:MAG: sodium:alanine symporter family protein [Clostridiales bacterium]|nr:sodium:alanine symporter family protein [Clostridiales bacterium]MBS6558998.1 sodium:alanine symporter family protein [Clostridiales bacterium]